MLGECASSSLISLKPSSGRCGVGGKPEVDQRELRRVVELAQQAFDLRARIRDVDVEVPAEHEVQRVGDQRIVVDDQQIRLDL